MDNVIAYEIKAPLHPVTRDLKLACDGLTSLTLMLDAQITYDTFLTRYDLQRIIGQFRPGSEATLVNNLRSTILPVLDVDLCDLSCKERKALQ